MSMIEQSDHQPVSHHRPMSNSFTLRHYLLATTPFLVIFLLMPFELFFNQADEWDLELSQLAMLPLAGLLGILVTSLLLAGLARVYQWLARAVAILLFVLGCYLLLADLYAPVQMAAMEGAALSSDEPLKYTLLEGAIGVVALLALSLLWRGRGQQFAVAFSALLAVVSVGYGGVVLASLLRPEPDLSPNQATAKAGAGNVYHIVLDRMQTDAFLDVVDRTSARSDFRGFELFSNNIANYLTTHPSRASYLSGTFYHTGKFKDWHTNIWREQGIQKLLADQGYRVWNYVPFRSWRDRDVDVFSYSIDLYEEKTGIPGSGIADFITLWLLRLAPNPLTNEALAPIRAARDVILTWLDQSAEADKPTKDQPKRLTVADGIQVLASKQMFEQLVIDEQHRSSSGEYVYLHAVMPHHPYVFDPACTFHAPPSKKPDDAGRRRAYLDQSACSIKLIQDFLDQLRVMNRYDDATILIHADTGAEEGFMADPPDYRAQHSTLGMVDNHLLSGTNALLMIKRPGQADPLLEIDRVTQLVDLFPSLADILGLEDRVDANVHGRSIYIDREEPREVRISFDPKERWGDDYVDVRIESPKNLSRSALTVVGPTVEPVYWRDEIRRGEN